MATKVSLVKYSYYKNIIINIIEIYIKNRDKKKNAETYA